GRPEPPAGPNQFPLAVTIPVLVRRAPVRGDLARAFWTTDADREARPGARCPQRTDREGRHHEQQSSSEHPNSSLGTQWGRERGAGVILEVIFLARNTLSRRAPPSESCSCRVSATSPPSSRPASRPPAPRPTAPRRVRLHDRGAPAHYGRRR